MISASGTASDSRPRQATLCLYSPRSRRHTYSMKVFEGNRRTRPEKHETPAEHICDYPDCGEIAPHRAPRAPSDLRSYRWFCLDHVREYNRAWNFFEGWSRRDIEHFQRNDVTGHRPTWPVYGSRPLHEEMDDLEGVFHNFSHDWFGAQRTSRNNNGGRGNKRSASAMDKCKHSSSFSRPVRCSSR